MCMVCVLAAERENGAAFEELDRRAMQVVVVSLYEVLGMKG